MTSRIRIKGKGLSQLLNSMAVPCPFPPERAGVGRGQHNCWLTILTLPILCITALSGLMPLCAASAPSRTENVFLITIDGFRWQDVFSGAEALLMDKTNGGVANVQQLKQAFWRDTPEARRQALLPFFWSVIATQGQLYG